MTKMLYYQKVEVKINDGWEIRVVRVYEQTSPQDEVGLIESLQPWVPDEEPEITLREHGYAEELDDMKRLPDVNITTSGGKINVRNMDRRSAIITSED